jgi:hypothetical protein
VNGSIHETDRFEIVSICPAAPGWKAAFRSTDGSVEYCEVAVWAVCLSTTVKYRGGRQIGTTKNGRMVSGLTQSHPGIEPSESCSNFLGYVAPGERWEEAVT